MNPILSEASPSATAPNPQEAAAAAGVIIESPRETLPPPRRWRRRGPPRAPDLEVAQILAWADAYRERTGEWPTAKSGIIPESGREKWKSVDSALRHALRGLPTVSSLPQLLAKHRGHRNRKALPALSTERILAWADAYRTRTGRWPTRDSGPIQDAPGETWMAVTMALAKGLRGLHGGSSLVGLLAEQREYRNPRQLPEYSEERVLAWADAHHRRTGAWPTSESGAVVEAPGETWLAVNHALSRGTRGLPGGSSLARLLAQHRAVRHRLDPGPLTVDQILAWVDAHHERTGTWPHGESGPIPGTAGETWGAVGLALSAGKRGLPGGTTLARFLEEHRGRPWKAGWHRKAVLTVEEILTWADAHRDRTGSWPKRDSGPVTGASDATWGGVDLALQRGRRGLSGGMTLAGLLAEHRNAPRPADKAPLTEAQILAWADRHRERTGAWPDEDAGAIAEAAGENWKAIQSALRRGDRGLPGGSSLARLLARYRGRRPGVTAPELTVGRILEWADAHRARTAKWPGMRSGPVEEACGQTWGAIDSALKKGLRGLPGGSSLVRLLAERRGWRDIRALPRLSPELILRWADAHHARHGRWPGVRTGPVEDAPGETWLAVESALRNGARGLPGGSSLARLRAEQRQKRHPQGLPDTPLGQTLASTSQPPPDSPPPPRPVPPVGRLSPHLEAMRPKSLDSLAE